MVLNPARLPLNNEPMPASKRPSWLMRTATLPFLGAIYAYRITLSPFLGGQCRFHPTCSRYALEAYQLYGPVRGSILTARRLVRCHPFGGKGYDPVPRNDVGQSTNSSTKRPQ